MADALPYKTWRRRTCGFLYDEAEGDVSEGLAPGAPWTDIPAGWVCPLCGAAKADFDMVELEF